MPSQTSHKLVPRALLSDWTTLGVGGPADAFVEVSDLASLADALAVAEGAGGPVLVLGGGSNVVVADAGFPGTVVRIAMRGLRFDPLDDYVVARVGAGEEWCTFVERCVADGLCGTECLERDPRAGGRNAGTERRGVRSGSLRHGHLCHGVGPAVGFARPAAARTMPFWLS